jgi:hypothetical protein
MDNEHVKALERVVTFLKGMVVFLVVVFAIGQMV